MQDKRVDNYFKAWLSYDTMLLTQIFSPEATYDIKPRERVLIGQDEICRYWKRNKDRQKKLDVQWDVINSTQDQAISKFLANFIDIAEQQNQSILGVIHFLFNKNGQIIALSETYTKTVNSFESVSQKSYLPVSKKL